jgi:type IV pilus assembly protein PilE
MKRITFRSSPSLGRKRANGFTLIELVVTVAIVAILATIAYASYESFITKSRRAAAATCLQERAQFMERFYTTNLSYLDPATGSAPAVAQCDAEISGFYQVSYQGAATAMTYVLQAIPQGVQATRDTLCGTLTVNQQGVRGEGGTATSADQCW